MLRNAKDIVPFPNVYAPSYVDKTALAQIWHLEKDTSQYIFVQGSNCSNK